MKNILSFISLITISLFLFSSCNGRSYAKELKEEKALIEDYIKRNGIRVVDKLPDNSAFLADEKLYYKSTSGLYYRLDKEGIRDTIQMDDDKVDKLEIQTRYYEYTLNVVADTADYWSPNRYPDPMVFVSANYNTGCPAFHEALSYMKKSESEAKLIVPSKLGFNSSVVTPYGYKIQIKFRKDVVPD